VLAAFNVVREGRLRSFVILAERLRFAQTARLLNLSQPALTKRIRQLESEIGGALFERTRNGTRLSSMGKDVLGFIRLPASREFHQKSVVEDALVLVSSSALSKSGKPISLNDYRQEPFVLISSQRSPTFRHHAINLCAKHGFVPKIVQEANDVPTLMALARAGIGLTFLPASACKTRLVGVKVHPIPDPEAI
jgi:DNA-binding transcriptional LysR family regulator